MSAPLTEQEMARRDVCPWAREAHAALRAEREENERLRTLLCTHGPKRARRPKQLALDGDRP